jgi:DNA-binding CsgD family transcriptional regulator
VRDASERDEGDIVVEVRLSDDSLARRIADWIEGSAAFVLGAAGAGRSAIIADHVPDDADDGAPWPHDARIAARLSRSVDLTKLRIAVEAAAHGLSIVDQVQGANTTSASRPILTARETEIMQLLAEGASNKAIARTLGITAHTVKFHVASILAKLGASSRTEAVISALRLGLLMV